MGRAREARCASGLPLALLLFEICMCAVPAAMSSEADSASWAPRPHRLHLEPTPNPAEVLVWWMSPISSDHSVVHYGFSPDALNLTVANNGRERRYETVPASSERSSSGRDDDDDAYAGYYNSEYIHTVLLTGLPTQPGITVFYQVDNWKGYQSDVMSLVTRGGNADELVRIAVFGDQVST